MRAEGRKMLVVSGDSNSAATLLSFFLRRGWRASAVTSLDEARARVQASLPDILVVESFVNGASAASWIQHVKGTFPDVRSICIVSARRGREVSRLARAGAWRIVAKPFSLRHLAEIADCPS